MEMFFLDGSCQGNVFSGARLLFFLSDVAVSEVASSEFLLLGLVHFFPLLNDLVDQLRLAEFWKHTRVLVVALPGELAINSVEKVGVELPPHRV